MKFTATRVNGKNVKVNLEPENSAELFQMKALRDQLFDEGAHCFNWSDIDGGRGICLVVENMPNSKYSATK